MFTLEVKKISIIATLALSIFMIVGCSSDPKKPSSSSLNVDGSVIYPRKNGKYSSYYVNKQNITNFTYGRTPTTNGIKAWNKDVMPDGTGLPNGEGSVEQGDALYEAQCAMCHGDFGAGGKGYPVLAGGQGTLKNQLLKEGDEPPHRTIGSYWPHASTLFWYIQSAMPFNHPKSLSNDETYALVAYLLSINEIQIDGKDLDEEYVLNREKFLKIKMPNVDGFVPNVDGDDAKEKIKEFLSNSEKYGKGTRCMSNCTEGKIPVVTINYELKDFNPPLSTKRDLAGDNGSSGTSLVSVEEKIYSETCSSCHANDALGAPVFGDKDAWSEVLKKGVDVVQKNALNGINGMPPKGGNMDLTDEQLKSVVNFMIQSSK
jgi:cytochrome c